MRVKSLHSGPLCISSPRAQAIAVRSGKVVRYGEERQPVLNRREREVFWAESRGAPLCDKWGATASMLTGIDYAACGTAWDSRSHGPATKARRKVCAREIPSSFFLSVAWLSRAGPLANKDDTAISAIRSRASCSEELGGFCTEPAVR